MKARLSSLLRTARAQHRAVAAFNVYTIDQAAGVLDAAEEESAPVILQVHPNGRDDLLWPLIAALRELADAAGVPVGLHLDHTSDLATMRRAAAAGVDSIMADGSHLDGPSNLRLVKAARAEFGIGSIELEGELGRLSGNEDGLSVAERDARLTDPGEAARFADLSGIHALAVCVGNVHGRTKTPPTLDLQRLAEIGRCCTLPLVLHGASGLPADVLRRTIALGVAKVNVNTEIREVYATSLRSGAPDELVEMLAHARSAVRNVATAVIRTVYSAQLAAEVPRAIESESAAGLTAGSY